MNEKKDLLDEIEKREKSERERERERENEMHNKHVTFDNTSKNYPAFRTT